jgi:hypothetical protein
VKLTDFSYTRLTGVLLALAAVAYLLAYFSIAFIRFRHPIPLEWMEDGMLTHVSWVLAGNTLYVPPTLTFTPFIYTPLYVYLAAVFSAFFGPSFPLLRLISISASLGIFYGIFRIIRDTSGSRIASLIGVGLFASAYRLGGAWLDIARNDSLFLALFGWGLYLLRPRPLPTPRSILAQSAVIFWLAYLTKQTALLGLAFLFPYIVVRERKRALAFAVPFLTLLAFTMAFFTWKTQGWYWIYTMEIPSGHPWITAALRTFWIQDLRSWWPVGVVGTVGLGLAYRTCQRALASYMAVILAAGISMAWFSRLHTGGYDNVLLPAFTAWATVAGIAFGLLKGEYSSRTYGWLPFGAFLLLGGHFAQATYPLRQQLPPPGSVEASRQLKAELLSHPGKLWLPDNSYLLGEAAPFSAPSWALVDIWISKSPEAIAHLNRDIAVATAEHRYQGALVSTDNVPGELRAMLPTKKILPFTQPLRPVTGASVHPSILYLPEEANR